MMQFDAPLIDNRFLSHPLDVKVRKRHRPGRILLY